MIFWFSLLFLLLILFSIWAYLAKPKCRNCGSRALNYLHLRADGNPDLRYKDNPIFCYSCKNTEATLKYKAIKEVQEHRAVKKYQAAYQGDASDQFNLGLMYDVGRPVEQNYDKAREWYEKAADQGHARAQYNLGIMYFYGAGVQQNLSVAKKFFGQSCENGEQDACERYQDLDELGY